MTRGMVCVNNVTYGGVYYSDDIVFGGASQPTWTRLATAGLSSTQITRFGVDENDPYNIFYAKIGYSYYRWNGAGFTEILNLTIARIVSPGIGGAGGEKLVGLGIDQATRRIWVNYGAVLSTIRPLYSDDYGANWSVATPPGSFAYFGGISAHNSVVWSDVNRGTLYRSPDNGATWASRGTVLSAGGGDHDIKVDRHDPDYCYTDYSDLGGGTNNLYRYYNAAIYTLVGNSPLNVNNWDAIWLDPNNIGHCLFLINDGGNLKLKTTTDSWGASVTNGAIGVNLSLSDIVAVRENPNSIAFWLFNINNPGGEPSCQGLTSESDTTSENKGGDNTNTAPYTDAVPSDFNIAVEGMYFGEGVPQGGVFVYADEQGDITDIPDADNLGVPLFGDRSSWRDYDADNDGLDTPTALSYYHAQDIAEDTPQRHNPWPAAAGEAPVSDGSEYVPTDIATQAELDTHEGLPNVHHDAVTLDADAAILLDLNVQEIGLDVQDANEVFAGPAAGAANEPTFRLLVEDDIPALPYADHEHVYQEIWEGDGVEDQFFTANEFETETTQVYLNGLLQVNGDDYDEDPGLGSITFVDPPEDVDTIQIAYIMAAA